ncbi:hypothetical protein EI77_00138 [Prosthecobacter fusiformis]|uniref:Uncharacterized protein n=1 Tax=Prosthecobacter fusiformis TaxID=48464 RepID=A0A4R7SNS9_9BACT|nr:hypothetical protein [Prosthecobacter fusiformis]TDU80840.1 hypothetical protein EI77_00138 [Prosthecobacter fusiformis]
MDVSPLISEHVIAQNIGIEKCDDYEIHYLYETHWRSPAQGPIVVYFPEKQTAFSSHYIPSPGLADRHSADFDPMARAITSNRWSNDRFLISKGGIRCNNPSISGLASIVARLFNTDGFERVFQPCQPPFIRWENLRLVEVPVPAGLSDYCDALKGKYLNGFVEAKWYEIEQGSVQDAIMGKRHPWWPNQFLEILRHPQVAHDFRYGDVDVDCLALVENWIHHSPFLLTGFFQQILCYGGAYSHYDSSSEAIAEALRLADGVFADFGSTYKDIELHVCNKPWCDRFYDVAWDHTWIIFSASMRQLTIILASDTD